MSFWENRQDLGSSVISMYCIEASDPYKAIADAENHMKKEKSSLRIFPGIGLVLKRMHFEARQFAFPLGHFQVCVFLYNSVCKSATCFIIPPLTNIVLQSRRMWLYVIQFPAYCWCSMNVNIRYLEQLLL